MTSFPALDSREAVQDYITSLVEEYGMALDDLNLATELDKRDKLASFRSKFHIPMIGELVKEHELQKGTSMFKCNMYMHVYAQCSYNDVIEYYVHYIRVILLLSLRISRDQISWVTQNYAFKTCMPC